MQKENLTKEYIYKLKNDSNLLERLMFENKEDTKTILFILKYIGKLQSFEYLSRLQQIAKDDESSIVRCEVVLQLDVCVMKKQFHFC